jgi:Mlc titration factor MtfA (ptsG expression regulator)
MNDYYSKPKWSPRDPEWVEHWEAMARGEMPVPDCVHHVIRSVMGEEVAEMLREKDFVPAKHSERHAAYKATIERLRNMPHMEAERQFDRYFHDLTPDDRSVLSQLITRPSIQRMADAIRMPATKFADIKDELEMKHN